MLPSLWAPAPGDAEIDVQKVVIGSFYYVALHGACLANDMVEIKRALRVNVVVPAVAQRVVLAD